MNYRITYEDDNCVEIRYNDVRFSITKETGTLYELINVGAPTDVVIPRTFPSGHQINYLNSTIVDNVSCGENMVQGIFKTITISNGIFVGGEAFQYAEVKKVIWNDCPCIPSNCFYESKVEEVTNITNVKEVMSFAFSQSFIKKVDWPEHCYTIPEGCFKGCLHLTELSVPYVNEIGKGAFYALGIAAFDWPTECSKIPDYCFANSKLSKINNINGITAIGEAAFANTKLETLDLSALGSLCLQKGSLWHLPEETNVILPYYISQEMCSESFLDFDNRS